MTSQESSPTSATGAANPMDTARLSKTQLEYLAQHGWVVAPNFISDTLAASLRDDIARLRGAGHFAVAKIGHDGMVQDEVTPFRDIRHSETCELTKGVHLPAHTGRDAAYQVLDQLREDLQAKSAVGPATQSLHTLDTQLAELMYAHYPAGGYYRRHCDAEAETPSAWRQFSFLLYLNPNWLPAHGGALRLHRDSGVDELPVGELPNFVDIPPQAGTLVVFRSDLVPHEVLTTNQERSAVVGWFLAAEDPNRTQNNNNHTNNPISVGQNDIAPDTPYLAWR